MTLVRHFTARGRIGKGRADCRLFMAWRGKALARDVLKLLAAAMNGLGSSPPAP